MKTKYDFTKDCGSKAAQKLINETDFFERLTLEVADEVAVFLSEDPKFSPKPTLLNRTPKKCHIPERDLFLFSSATTEEALSSNISKDANLIRFIQTIDPKKYTSLAELLTSDEFFDAFGEETGLESSGIIESLESHPLISGNLIPPDG